VEERGEGERERERGEANVGNIGARQWAPLVGRAICYSGRSYPRRPLRPLIGAFYLSSRVEIARCVAARGRRLFSSADGAIFRATSFDFATFVANCVIPSSGAFVPRFLHDGFTTALLSIARHYRRDQGRFPCQQSSPRVAQSGKLLPARPRFLLTRVCAKERALFIPPPFTSPFRHHPFSLPTFHRGTKRERCVPGIGSDSRRNERRTGQRKSISVTRVTAPVVFQV